MKILVVTGAAGLVGSECVNYFSPTFDMVVGVDNNQRKDLFGGTASVNETMNKLKSTLPNYTHVNVDIRNEDAIRSVYARYNTDITAVIHAAAQPSHDLSASRPRDDFTINALGTFIMLENTRQFCPDATFIHVSTNKVYGERINYEKFVEGDTRYKPSSGNPYGHGISESMSIDTVRRSPFGASKTAADILAQEYGKYFGLNTGIFRCGCITGPNHMGAELHGFLAYLVKCLMLKESYTIYGYKGKQVRDNIHSWDLAHAFDLFLKKPRRGEVYNMGGGKFSNCSILEAIAIVETLTGLKLEYNISDKARESDHIWWISDTLKFRTDYGWEPTHNINGILEELVDNV
jgi:CDP-paratose 2-epimerase